MDALPTTLLSVRGVARVTVAPDAGTLSCRIEHTADTKPDALRAVAADLTATTTALAALGGRPLTVADARHALTWSTRSAGSWEEHRTDQRTGESRPTGRIEAVLDVAVTVRDLDRLDAVGAALASVDGLHVQFTSWSADDDNAAWPQVRADAVRAAIAQARDYAAALGGALLTVEHVADLGLLGGDTGNRPMPSRVAMRVSASAGSSGAEPASLDPVPQELVAGIEARFTASAAPVND